MREIKFRAYYKGKRNYKTVWKQRPQYTENLTFDFEFQDFCWNYGDYGIDKNTDIIVQYTGLKDKKGVEIYEGDVVQHSYKTNNGWYKRKPLMEVKFELNKCDDYPYEILGWNVPIPNTEQRLEVIGNIYENPNLLK